LLPVAVVPDELLLDVGCGVLDAVLEVLLHAAATLIAAATPAKATTRDRDMDLAGRWDIVVGLPSTGRNACSDRARCPRR
jgi:hypothetical protein